MENEELTKVFWMSRLGELLEKPELKNDVIGKLELVDPHFATRSGLNDFTNAKRGKASVTKTALVVTTLEKYLEDLKPVVQVSKALRRQKLSV